MTAPALPGAAPDPAPGRNDPARLPPEVERLLQAALLDAYNHGWAVGAKVTAPVGPDTEAPLRTAIARALGGDGEPVLTDWDCRLAEFDDDPRLAPAASEVRRVRALWANEPSADRTKCMDRAIAGAVLRFVDSTRPAATGDHPSEARRGQGAAGDQGGPDAR